MILALETAAEIGGVALVQESATGASLIGERVIGDRSPRHATELLGAVGALLAEAGHKLREVTAIAVSIGPGSFTGLRIGLATALGFCFGTDRSIIPVPTLAALSLHAGDASPIVPLLDARKGQVYTGVYAPGGVSLRPDRVCDPLSWLRELAEPAGEDPLYFLGPGAQLYRNEIETVLGTRARLLGSEASRLRAGSVGLLGARLAAEGGARRPEEVEPCYLRPSQAERGRPAGHHPAKPIT